MTHDPRVASGKGESAFFVLSDMLDNAPDQEQSLQNLLDTMATYANQGHVIGLYYVDQLEVTPWQQPL